jgi:Thioredoxin like C-terminal domain
VNEDERWIQDLLKERSEQQTFPGGIVSVQAQGAEAAPDMDDVKSPETYVGYERAQHFASPGGLNQGDPQLYPIPRRLELNQWALAGKMDRAGPDSFRSIGRCQASSFPGDHRRQGSRGKPTELILMTRGWHHHREPPISTGTTGGRDHRPYIHDRVPRSRSAGLLLHLRVGSPVTQYV